MTNTLIAMVGLPRSGKSTVSKELSVRFKAPIVSRDCLRLAVHGQRYLKEAEPLIKSLDLYMVRALFLAGHSVVIVDETNYSRAARNHLRDPSWNMVFYPVGTAKEICQDRAIFTKQEDLVPVIEEMDARWEDFEPTDMVLTHMTMSDRKYHFKSSIEDYTIKW